MTPTDTGKWWWLGFALALVGLVAVVASLPVLVVGIVTGNGLVAWIGVGLSATAWASTLASRRIRERHS